MKVAFCRLSYVALIVGPIVLPFKSGQNMCVYSGVETAPTTALLAAESTFQNWPCRFQNATIYREELNDPACQESKWPQTTVLGGGGGSDMPLCHKSSLVYMLHEVVDVLF